VEFIRAAIRARGPVSFAWFMEQALYHPGHGYYSSGRCTIGRAGDYYTNVSAGPLFGRLLAAQFVEMWETLQRPNDFKIVEQGAHGGEFARDVLDAARTEHAEFFEAIRYEIVEPIPVLRERQVSALRIFPAKVEWRDSLDSLPLFRGVHFSNELIDAMRVHLVRWTGSKWMERHVTERDARFAFVDLPISAPELEERLANIPMPLPADYETEVNLGATRWIEALSQKLIEGYVLAVDYGWPRSEYYAPQRTTGTLRCYAQHRVLASPFAQIGAADITAHVEWTSLIEHAEQRCILTCRGLSDQHHFITGLLAKNRHFAPPNDARNARALQTLLHPSQLGMKFQYLVLSRSVENAPLSGLSFARSLPSV